MSTPRVDKQKLLDEFKSRFEHSNRHTKLRITKTNWAFWVNPWSYPHLVQYVSKDSVPLGDAPEVKTFFRFVIEDGVWKIVD